jgi:hypothetical protein
MRDEEFDKAGKFIGDEVPAPDDDSPADDREADRRDDGLDEEPPATQPRS